MFMSFIRREYTQEQKGGKYSKNMTTDYKIICNHCNKVQTTTYKLFRDIPEILTCDSCSHEFMPVENAYIRFYEVSDYYEEAVLTAYKKLKEIGKL